MVSKFTVREYYQIQVYESYFWCYVVSIPITWNRANKYENKYDVMQVNMKILILNSLGKLKSIFLWMILIVVHKVQKVLNLIKVKNRISKVSFNIRKWRTNDPELRKLIHDYENREVVNVM